MAVSHPEQDVFPTAPPSGSDSRMGCAVVPLTAPGGNGADRNYTIEIGAKDPGGSDYIVRSSESEYVVLVAGPSLEEQVSCSGEDFLQEEPTPTPGS